MKSIDFLKSNNVAVEKALEVFGDIETYNETLIEFSNCLDNKIAEIKGYYETEDMPNYAIYVHSLKSDCKYFGFLQLADTAYQHELASKANNLAFVKQNFDAFMEEVNAVKKVIIDYLSGTDDVKPVVEQVTEEVEFLDEKNVILVADDSEVIRIFVKKIFERDYILEFAEDGEEALTIIKKYENTERIKAILLDLNMPKVDGFKVLEYLQEQKLFSKMPVTIVSGDSSSEVINKAFTYPIIDMISKPFNEEKIKEAILKTIAN